MQKVSVLVWVYAVIVLIGGIVGFLVANSTPSLVASSLTTLLLLAMGYYIRKGACWAYTATLGVLGLLLVFFGYRFYISHWKPFPGGVMVFLTAALLAYLIVAAYRARLSGLCHTKDMYNCCHKDSHHNKDNYNNTPDRD
ncbi:MAG: TMEM14 family protein [Candidatus Protochlamydia sp.]|nr:TMEM14 family protein [Candidatus Protochlamydia sp.]